MPLFMATIELLIDVPSEAEACDAVSETLRPLLKEFAENPADTCFVDWRYSDAHTIPTLHDGSGFEYSQLGTLAANIETGLRTSILLRCKGSTAPSA